MTRLILILFGGDALIQRWRAIFGLGVLTLLVALAVLGDLVDGVADITTLLLGLILLALALFELMVGATHTGVRRQLELLRGLVMLTGASLVLDFPWDNAITSGAIFGVAFCSMACSAWWRAGWFDTRAGGFPRCWAAAT
ncbi:MAG: hypothetical protein KA145_10655 [Alicycliphilus sp.]|jgi:hypothetical protein|nr:hypothetical protein [Alicycliphilus sp.]MBP7537032.1 hypothetical protein [Ottowia sp.]MBP9955137.1 hypothetical protein [Ottowia sp.]HRL35845.1 hypothetical protein [Ottowia beijingensis]